MVRCWNKGRWWKGHNYFKEDNILLNTINSFLSNNNTVCSLIFCIELTEKGAIASHIQVIESFNLPNSVKRIVAACHFWERDIILDFVLAISFSCSSHDLTIIKKNHTFSNSLLVTVVTQFTTRTIYYFLSLMSYLIHKLSLTFYSQVRKCVFSYCTYKKNCCTKKWGAGVLFSALAPVSTTLPKGSTNLFSQ